MNIRPTLASDPDRAVRLYTLLLLLYPPIFRHAYGEDMRLLFRDCLRDAQCIGGNAIGTLWLSTLLDVVRSAPRAHLEEWTTMQASYTRTSQLGAISAVVATLLWIFTFTIGDMFTALGNVGATTVVLFLFVTTFGALVGLYVRVTAAHPSPIAFAGGICGLLGLVGGISACVGWWLNAENSWSWATTMLSLGLLALAFTIMGIVASGQRDLGLLRFAPLLPIGFTFTVVILLFFYSTFEESGKSLGPVLQTLAVVGVAGTGLLLWTRAK